MVVTLQLQAFVGVGRGGGGLKYKSLEENFTYLLKLGYVPT